MNTSFPGQAPVHLLGQKAIPAGEPPLGLHEIEEQNASELKQNESLRVLSLADSG